MSTKISLLLLCFTVTFLHAQNPDSATIQYTVDTIASPTCYKSGDGAILLDSVSVPGTIDRYEWSNGSDMEDLIFVNGGSYQLTVYNTNGESFESEEFIISEPDSLFINRFISPPTETNLDNGFIDLTIHGGTQPFRLTMIYNLDTSIVTTDSTFTLAKVDTGRYIFSVLDANGCTDTTQLDVSARPCEILVTALVEPSQCDESISGRIELLIENAVEPVNIDWATGPDNQKILNNLAAGEYSFIIRDRRKCSVTDSIQIKNEDKIPPEAVVNDNVVLYLNNNGKAQLATRQVLIGAKDDCHNNLQYLLEQSQFTCKDVGTKEINFFISDGVGNTTVKPIQVEVRDTQSIKLIYPDTVYTALCNGIAQYTAPKVQGSCSTASTSGIVKSTNREITTPGTYVDRYYYVKNPGDTLKANMTVIVADTRVRAFLLVEEPQCSTGEDGSVVVALRNSNNPISYQWDDGSDQDYIFGIVNNRKYEVTVTEGNGCVFDLSAVIEGPDSLSVGLKDVIEKEGTVDIIPQVNGGNKPLLYTWYNGGKIISESENLLNVPDGERYQLIVTDVLGCMSSPLVVNRTMTSSTPAIEYRIDLFPNPVSDGSLHIRFRQGSEAYTKIRLINNQQQVLKEISLLQPDMNLSLKSIPPGLYFIQFLRKDGGLFSKKIIRM